MKKIISVFLTLTLLAGLCGCASAKYNEAKELMGSGDYAAAKEILLENPDYEDSGELIRECDYNRALLLMVQGDYENACLIFSELDDYKSSKENALDCQNKALYLDKIVGKWTTIFLVNGEEQFPSTAFGLEFYDDFTFFMDGVDDVPS